MGRSGGGGWGELDESERYRQKMPVFHTICIIVYTIQYSFPLPAILLPPAGLAKNTKNRQLAKQKTELHLKINAFSLLVELTADKLKQGICIKIQKQTALSDMTITSLCARKSDSI